jgi:uncharacterized protein DUF3226
MVSTGGRIPQPASTITHEKLLVVEGEDARRFFAAALGHLDLLGSVEIRSAGGHAEWPAFMRALVAAPGFENVRSLALVRDAEGSARSAFQSICGTLRRAGLAVPARSNVTAPGTPSVCVFILPDCTHRGMLETLCMAVVADDPAMVCVEEFLECVQQQATAPPSNVDKARLHAFLASRTRPDLRLGEAAEKGHWPWDSPVMEPVMRFLTNL